jgi:hypothetical protein
MAGLASRLLLTSVETRYQLLAFAVVALALQFASRSRVRAGTPGLTFICCFGAAAIAICLTRFALEGLPAL